MRDRFIQLLTRTDMDETERAAAVPTLRTLVIIAMVGSGTGFVLAFFGAFVQQLSLATAFMFLGTVGCHLLLKRGMLLPSQVFLPTVLLIGVTVVAWTAYGLHDEVMIAYAFIVVLAELTLGAGAAFLFAGLIVVVVFVIGIAEMTGFLVSPTSSLTMLPSPFVISMLIIAIAFAQRTLANLLRQSVRRARESEKAQKEINVELQALQNDLEKRVSERTLELDEANKRSERRAGQLRAVTEVSSAIALTHNLEELLPEITIMVSRFFGFYHVGIFLNDANNLYAILSAANSEGGKRMLDRKHRLKIGEQGIVGYVTHTGEPRISLDVGADAIYFNNPDLPDTRSESAIPLKVGGNIVGALDVQSTEPNAFTPDDIEVLTILAEQVSMAIETARLFQQTQKSLQEAEAVYRQYLREAWTRLPQEQKLTGFRFSGAAAMPIAEPLDQKAASANGDGSKREVSVPVMLRGEKIGELVVQVPKETRIKSDQMDLIRAVAERVALSVENARLFEETSRRAERERMVTDITAKIRGTNKPEDMLRTAMEELQRALGATRVEIVPQKSSFDPDK
ncbi:MAG: GAF domain-containing protein [Chloroflexota bacterium]